MRRLLILPAVAIICTAEIYRRGFIAPLLYGARRWSAARPDWCYQPDPIA